MAEQHSPPRGWYPDPGGRTAWRWWDGKRWTEDLEDYARPSGRHGALLNLEAQAGVHLLRFGVPLLVLALVVGTWLNWLSLGDLAAQLRWAKATLIASIHHDPLPTQPQQQMPAWQSAANWLIAIPAEIIGGVLLLRFQLKAARVAQQLGLGDRPSPGLGVGGWFIPIAQLWIPLRAWLHLTTPRSRLRNRIWLAWSALFLSVVASLSGAGACLVSLAWARGLLGLSLAADLVAIWLLPGMIRGIELEHRRADGGAEGERGVAVSL